MKHFVTRNLHQRTAIFCLAIAMAAVGFAQPAATPVPATAAVPAAIATPDANDLAIEPVRQAIARQDYQAASQALEAVRQQNPNNPHIPLYGSIIKSRQEQGQTVGGPSPLRTPRPGVTPGPTPEATPTPVPTPVPTPSAAPAAEAESGGLQAQAEELFQNESVRYGAIALGVLVLLGIMFLVIKKRKAAKELEEPIAASSLGGGGMDDYSGAGGAADYTTGTSTPTVGLAGSPLSTDYTPESQGVGAYGAPESSESGSGGSALSGSALAGAGGLAGYTVPSFGEEEEESAPPPQNRRPAPKPEEDVPLNLNDEPPATPLSEAQMEPTTADALGLNLGASATGEAAPAQPEDFAAPDEETKILPAQPPTGATPTPTATQSVEPGTVDLSDIFGTQQPPAPTEAPFSNQPTIIGNGANEPFNDEPTPAEPQLQQELHTPSETGEDENSQTLPTFVSAPGAENPEENVELPPKPVRGAEGAGEDQTISFEELFGAQGMPAAEPEPETAPEPTPEPEQPTAPASEVSIEDALAATLGAMQAESPEEQPTAAQAETPAESTETLDERSERMFHEQMAKARSAYDEKNWRQAVHFLSIASALHPENEEAKQMLKEARTEKRKAEESV